MNIPIQLHRQRIGLYANIRVKNGSHSNQNLLNLLYIFISFKIRLAFLNSLSINTSLFVFLSQVITCKTNFEAIDPALASILGLLILVCCINLTQFTLIYSYIFLVKSTHIFYICIAFLLKIDKLELFMNFYFYKHLEMLTHGDIHPHPGPPPSLFKFMHWNINSIPAHDFERIPLLQAYTAQENFTLMAITETALKNDIPDEKIEIDGYSVIRCNLSKNNSHGGVLLYHKNDLSIKNRTDLCQLSDTIVTEISISRKNKLLLFLIENMVKPTRHLPPILKMLAKSLTK